LKALILAASACVLLCVVSVAMQVADGQSSRSGERRRVARSVAGSARLVRQSERLGSEVHLENRTTSATVFGPEPSPALFCFGVVVIGRSVASSQLHSAAALGRAPPRRI
jgi:hypothetical protein